jgi:hypothetical protein
MKQGFPNFFGFSSKIKRDRAIFLVFFKVSIAQNDFFVKLAKTENLLFVLSKPGNCPPFKFHDYVP